MKWTRQIHKPVSWRCDVDHPAEQFDTDNEFAEHLQNEHSEYTAAQQEAISSSSKVTRRRPRNVCPLCNYDISTPHLDSKKAKSSGREQAKDKAAQKSDEFQKLSRLSKHIAGHLWCLALASATNLNSEPDRSSNATTSTATNRRFRREGSRVRPPSGVEHLSNVKLDLPKSPGKFLWRIAIAKVLDEQRTLHLSKDLSESLAALTRIRRVFDRDWTVVDLYALFKNDSRKMMRSTTIAVPQEECASWPDTVAFLKDRMDPEIKADVEDELQAGRKIEEDPIQHMITYSLWDRAFDNIRREEPDLVKEYEELLSEKLVKDAIERSSDTKTRVISQQPEERRAVLDTLIRGGLERLGDQSLSSVTAARTLKRFVNDAFKVSPSASLAWAGVCLILPLLTDPKVVEEADKCGFIYVTTHLSYYALLETLLWSKSREQAVSDPILLLTYEAHLLDLYRHVLDLQMTSVIHFSRDDRGALGSGQSSAKAWTTMLLKVQELENILVVDSKKILDPASQQKLIDIAHHARDINLQLKAPKRRIRLSLKAPTTVDQWYLADIIPRYFETSTFDFQERQYLPDPCIKEHIVTMANVYREFSRASDCSQYNTEDLAAVSSWVVEAASKVFAITVQCHLDPNYLLLATLNFYQEDFDDKQLPINDPRVPHAESIPPIRPSAFTQAIWSQQRYHEFFRFQWSCLAPIFVPDRYEYDLPLECIMPFKRVKDTDPKRGAFGSVFKIVVHTDHQQRYSALEVQSFYSTSYKRSH